MAVHHVDMQKIRAAPLNGIHLISQSSEVRRQN
jgi:hypothetical protein